MLCSKNQSSQSLAVPNNLNKNLNDKSTSIPVVNAPRHLSKHVTLAENNLTTFNRKSQLGQST